jgi:hypothetical protein
MTFMSLDGCGTGNRFSPLAWQQIVSGPTLLMKGSPPRLYSFAYIALSGIASPSLRRRSARFPRESSVTSDPRPDDVGGIQVRPSAHTRPTARPHSAASYRGHPTVNAASSDNSAITTGAERETLILRSGNPPVDQLDFDDRHDTRATESDALARRYSDLRKNRRRDDWHKLLMSLVGFAVLAIVYIAGFIVVSRLLPHLGPWLAAKIVGLAFVAASGGVVVRSAGQVLRRRTNRPHDRDPTST